MACVPEGIEQLIGRSLYHCGGHQVELVGEYQI